MVLGESRNSFELQGFETKGSHRKFIVHDASYPGIVRVISVMEEDQIVLVPFGLCLGIFRVALLGDEFLGKTSEIEVVFV